MCPNCFSRKVVHINGHWEIYPGDFIVFCPYCGYRLKSPIKEKHISDSRLRELARAYLHPGPGEMSRYEHALAEAFVKFTRMVVENEMRHR